MKKDIYAALNAVMKEVGYVQKKRTAGLNYTFAGEAALIAAIRPELVAQGVVVHPGQVVELRQDTYTTRNGAVMNRTAVVITYRFAHAESGTFIDTTVVGEGADVGDKSANKALTGAYKYALRQTLLIETGDDPDNFQSEQRSNGDAVTEVRMSTAKPLAVPSAVKPAQAEDNRKLTRDEYLNVIVANLGYKNVPHVIATMKVIGFDKVIPEDSDARRKIYEALKEYRAYRDQGLPQDEALQAMADREAQDA